MPSAVVRISNNNDEERFELWNLAVSLRSADWKSMDGTSFRVIKYSAETAKWNRLYCDSLVPLLSNKKFNIFGGIIARFLIDKGAILNCLRNRAFRLN